MVSKTKASLCDKSLVLCLTVIIAQLILVFSSSHAAANTVNDFKIGILAKRGTEIALQRWAPTADYLNATLPGNRFQIVPLNFDQVNEAIMSGSIDFLITNSGYYVELEADHNLLRMATLINGQAQSRTYNFGGVIFTRADREDINTLADIRGKSFWAVDQNSLGGWLAAWQEFQSVGINPEKDLKLLKFSGTHDSVVLAVANRLADSGTVRTDTLERMQAEGKINISAFKILNSQQDSHFPYLLSTGLYPEWPFAALPHISPKIVANVSDALVKLPANSQAARTAQISGWTKPRDYQPIKNLLKQRHLYLYEKFIGHITFQDFLRKYWHASLIIIVAIISLIVITINKALLSRQLELKVARRTRDLKQQINQRKRIEDKLHQAEKMEAIGTLAGGIAHNFNNNLAMILGNLEMAKMKIDQPEAISKYLVNANTAALRARDLIKRIMFFSRPKESERSIVPLDPLISETLLLLRSTIPSTVTLNYRPENNDKPINIFADPSQIQEALVNLCANAAQAISKNGTISILLKRTDASTSTLLPLIKDRISDYACISVEDTGSGIPEEIVDKIFDPFFTTKDVDQGTGLGLATVKKIVSQHNGMINVHSTPGKGTKFEIFLPISEDQQLSLNDIQNFPGGSESILLVDDEPLLTEIESEILSEAGYKVTIANSSAKALEIFRSAPENFDLVITDLAMPEMDGHALATNICSIHADMPIILCTGINDRIALGTEASCLKTICNKPLQIAELLQTVRNTLDGNFP